MTIFQIFNVMGGLAFFLFGMHVMSNGLKEAAGGRMEEMLQKMTDHPAKSFAFGAFITIAIQSSSALTVMLVGLVNSGIMDLTQTVGIIMGSNVGTTLTAWILGTSGIETDNIFWTMLKPEYLSLLVALAGVVMLMAAKERRIKDIGLILIGFSVLMHGMQMMSDTLKPLAEVPGFARILTAFQNPFLGVFVGTIFTGVIQSSAASVGVLQALSLTGQISYGMAIPIIMGQNIGTCVTVLLSSIGVSKNAKRVSIIHISFNLIGTLIGMAVFLVCDHILGLAVLQKPITPFAIAGFHSVFNILTTVVLLPFSGKLVSLAKRLVKEEASTEVFLDERLLLSPALAVEECRKKTVVVMHTSFEGLRTSLGMFEKNNDMAQMQEEIERKEMEVDEMVEKCNQFLIRLSSSNISKTSAGSVADMLQGLGDLERISDYSVSLARAVKKMKKISPKYYTKEFKILNQNISEVLTELEKCYADKNYREAKEIQNKAYSLVHRIKGIRKRDIKGLRSGKGDAELSVYVTEYLTSCRRVVEHTINIADCLVENA